MAVSATVTITVTSSGLPGGQALNFSSVVTLSSAVGTEKTMDLTTTPTSVAVPTGATYVIIQPPAGNATNLLVGGASVALANMATLHPTDMTALAIPTSAPSVLLACASGTVAGVVVAFF